MPVLFKTKELEDKKESRDCCKKIDTFLNIQIAQEAVNLPAV